MHIKFTRTRREIWCDANIKEQILRAELPVRLWAYWRTNALSLLGNKEKTPLSLLYLMRTSAYEIWILSRKTYYFVITKYIATRFYYMGSGFLYKQK